MVTGVRESTRTLLYSTCIFGLWVPIVWLVGAVLVVRELRVAPPSTYKRGMHVSFGLVLSLLALFGVAAAIAGVSVQRFIEIAMVYAVQNPQWQLNLKIISGFLLSPLRDWCLLFVAFADATFRSTLGPVVNELHAPLFLRGVHLGLNISGMLLPMPLFSMVGIPVTLRQISAMRRKGGAPACFTSTWVCGILAFVSIVAVFLFIVIGGSMPSGQKREDFAATQLAKLEMGCFKPHQCECNE
jgi:uncharacterized membrane protein YidH (DUF202 family)